jgi:hypothetical protein
MGIFASFLTRIGILETGLDVDELEISLMSLLFEATTSFLSVIYKKMFGLWGHGCPKKEFGGSRFFASPLPQ